MEKKNLGIICKHCGSTNIVKYGRHFGKTITQLYACKDCHRKFSFGSRMKFRIAIIEDALIYLLNHSLRETANYINEKYKINVHHESIHKWKRDFLTKGTVLGKTLNPNVKQQFTLIEMLMEREDRLLRKVMEFEDKLKDMEDSQREIINIFSVLKRGFKRFK